jgi:hypothetical protein
MSSLYSVEIVTATITTGTSLSAQVNLGDRALCGIYLPSNWTTASLSFQASPDGGTTFGELLDSAAAAIAVSSVAADKFIAMDADRWRCINCIKVRSGTSGAATNQTNTVAIKLLTRYVA